MITRVLIENFSKKNDILLDPFCGGGTTAIEALALGRRIICSDISPFACFVTRAKATPLSSGSIEAFSHWYRKEIDILKKYKPNKPKPLEISGKKYSPLTHSTILKLMNDTENIQDSAARCLAQLVVLNVAKRSLDGRSRTIPHYLINGIFQRISNDAIGNMRAYSSMVRLNGANHISRSSFRVTQCDAKYLANNLSKLRNRIKLVVTSPPYPGVHVLYNRWQVHGRKETDLPFRLLSFDSRYVASFYTLGTRANLNMKNNYLRTMERVLKSIHKLLVPGGVLAQVIAFPRNDGHISEYEDLMKQVGFRLIKSNMSAVRRHVPNRKWYTQLVKHSRQPIEHIFIHKKI